MMNIPPNFMSDQFVTKKLNLDSLDYVEGGYKITQTLLLWKSLPKLEWKDNLCQEMLSERWPHSVVLATAPSMKRCGSPIIVLPIM